MRYLKTKLKLISRISILLFTILLSISLLKSINNITSSNQKIQDAQNKLKELKKQNEELKIKVEGVQTQDFIEKQARDKLGLAKPGETVVVLPDPELLKKLAPERPSEETELPDPNWKKWAKLFF